MRVRLKFCTVEHRADHILTTFDDGATSANWPHPDDPSYVAVARQCGFDDLMAYTFFHELSHALVPELFFDRPSYVVWMAAHHRSASLAAAKAEERLIYYCQTAAVGRIPVIDPQWEGVIDAMARFGLYDHVVCSQPVKELESA